MAIQIINEDAIFSPYAQFKFDENGNVLGLVGEDGTLLNLGGGGDLSVLPATVSQSTDGITDVNFTGNIYNTNIDSGYTMKSTEGMQTFNSIWYYTASYNDMSDVTSRAYAVDGQSSTSTETRAISGAKSASHQVLASATNAESKVVINSVADIVEWWQPTATGVASATFSASNAPAAIAPTAWIKITLNGVPGYIPFFSVP